TFEEATFSILPSCLLLLLSPWRLAALRGRTIKTGRSWRYALKLSILAVLGIIQASLIAVVSTRQHVDFQQVLVASTAVELTSLHPIPNTLASEYPIIASLYTYI
ncbi:Multidrug resistance-associated protein 1, partial [Diaporthe eres]